MSLNSAPVEDLTQATDKYSTVCGLCGQYLDYTALNMTERIWKEALMAQVRYYAGIYLE
jgi:hypothetical protein